MVLSELPANDPTDSRPPVGRPSLPLRHDQVKSYVLPLLLLDREKLLSRSEMANEGVVVGGLVRRDVDEPAILDLDHTMRYEANEAQSPPSIVEINEPVDPLVVKVVADPVVDVLEAVVLPGRPLADRHGGTPEDDAGVSTLI
jgi:hypothetical protein